VRQASRRGRALQRAWRRLQRARGLRGAPRRLRGRRRRLRRPFEDRFEAGEAVVALVQLAW